MFLTQAQERPQSEMLRRQHGQGNWCPMPQKGTEKRRSSENVISTDTSALLWIYCREIAPFETPIFSKNVGELIARATSVPQKRTGPRWRLRPADRSADPRHLRAHPAIGERQ